MHRDVRIAWFCRGSKKKKSMNILLTILIINILGLVNDLICKETSLKDDSARLLERVAKLPNKNA